MRTFDSDCKSPTEEKAEEKRGKKGDWEANSP